MTSPPTNPWWRSFIVQGHRYPLASMEILVDGVWLPADRKDYNYWSVGDGNIGPAPWTVRLTDVNGSVVEYTIEAASESDIQTDVQFPICNGP